MSGKLVVGSCSGRVGASVHNESRREAALRALDAKYSPDVVDALLEQLVSMLKFSSGTAAATAAQLAANSSDLDDDFEPFAMPKPGERVGQAPRRIQGNAYSPFGGYGSRGDLDDDFESFAMP